MSRMTWRTCSLALWKAVTSIIGPDEVFLLVALTLVTVALWPLAVRWCGTGLPSLLPAGICLLWSAIPARSPFVVPPTVPEKPTRRPS